MTAERVGSESQGRPVASNDVSRPLRQSFAGSAAAQLTSVGTGLLLARGLGPHDRGVLAAVMLWPGLVGTLAALGMTESITYAAARRRDQVGRIVGSAVGIGAAQALVVLAATALLIPIVLADLTGDERRTAFVFLAFLPLNSLALYLMSTLNGLQSFGWFQAIRVVGVLTTLGALALLALRGQLSVFSAVLTYIAANIAMLLLAAARVRVCVGQPLRFSLETARELLGYGVRSHVGTVGSFLSTRLDQLVISLLLAPAKLGIYTVAVTVTSLTALVGSSVAGVGLSAVAHLDDEARRRRAARDLVALTFLASVIVTLPLLVWMPVLVRVAFGPEWGGAVGPARALLVGAVFLSTVQALGAVLRAVGRPLSAAYAELIGLPVLAAGLIFLLPAAGLVGAGIATAIAYIVMGTWMLHRASAILGIDRREFLPQLNDARQLASLLGVRRATPKPNQAVS